MTETTTGSGYRGTVIVRGADGEIWDVVEAALAPLDDNVYEWGGSLHPKPGASLSWWSGPVTIEIPGGRRVEAQVNPVGGAKPVSRVVASGVAPWDE